jgi:branched-chain amino acid transport system substrate-binding protein
MAVADDYGLGASNGNSGRTRRTHATPAAVTSFAPSDKDIKDKGADSLVLFGRPPT